MRAHENATVVVSDRPYAETAHFRSAGARLALERGEIERAEAVVRVPVYRGVDARTAREMRYAARRREHGRWCN